MPSRLFRFMLYGCLLLLATACDRPEEHQKQTVTLPVLEVQVATVVSQAMIQENEVMGTVTAVERATISARVGGVVQELPFKLGSTISKGDLLARIGADEIAARLSQAEARLDQARRNMEREQRLLEKNAATREGVKSLEEGVQMAEAAYQEAKTMEGYTSITAPFSGLVAQKLVNVGDLVAPGTPLLLLENNSKLQIVMEMTEAFAQRVTRQQKLPFTVPAADFSGEGTITEIAPMADPLSRTATVKMTIGSQPRLRPGQFARVRLSGPAGSALLVPESAVQTYGQMEQVFVVEDNTAHLRLVRSGEHGKGLVEIVSGLNSGEQVVIANGERLVDGQPVRVTP